MSARGWLTFSWLLPALALAQTESAREHVPPAPPTTQVHDMSYADMASMMGMDDRARFSKVMLDELEWRDMEGSALGWAVAAWHGGDLNKAWLATEGEREHGASHARVELLWDRVATRWWNTRAGVRVDTGDGPSRTWRRQASRDSRQASSRWKRARMWENPDSRRCASTRSTTCC